MDRPLTERYSEQILGVLCCFDRIVIMGTLPEICHAKAMEALLRSKGMKTDLKSLPIWRRPPW